MPGGLVLLNIIKKQFLMGMSKHVYVYMYFIERDKLWKTE